MNTEDTGTALSRWTLRFRDAEVEAGFIRHHVENHATITRRALLGAAVISVAFLGYKLAFAPEVFLNFTMIVLMLGMAAVFLVVQACPRRLLSRSYGFGALYLLAIGFILLATRDFPLPRRQLTSGFFICAMLFNSVMPYGWREKTASCLATVALFFGFALRDRVYDPAAVVQLIGQFAGVTILAVFVSYALERLVRVQFYWRKAAQAGQAQADALLGVVLPEAIAARLKAGEQAIVDEHPAVTILFADVVGFTKLAADRTAAETALILNDIFQRFDAVARQLGIEKVKTIGDSFMAIAGAPEPREDHARLAADMALEIREALVRYRAMTGHELEIRIGLNSGPVAAGIIGRSRFLYDYWGDTVNLASRMETTGLPGQIQISARTAALLADAYELVPRRGVEIKGKGTVDTFILTRPRLTRRPAA